MLDATVIRIAETDAVLIQEALPILSELSGERIRNEIDRVLLEKKRSEDCRTSRRMRRMGNHLHRLAYIGLRLRTILRRQNRQ